MKTQLKEILKHWETSSNQLERNDLGWEVRLFHYKKIAANIELLGEIVNSGKIDIKDVPAAFLQRLNCVKPVEQITAANILLAAIEMYHKAGDSRKAIEIAIDHEITEPKDLMKEIFEKAIDLAAELNDKAYEKRYVAKRSELFQGYIIAD